MPLTDYLMQSLSSPRCSTAGASVYTDAGAGRLPRADRIIFAVQVVLQPVVDDAFGYGPLEWSWRALRTGASLRSDCAGRVGRCRADLITARSNP